MWYCLHGLSQQVVSCDFWLCFFLFWCEFDFVLFGWFLFALNNGRKACLWCAIYFISNIL